MNASGCWPADSRLRFMARRWLAGGLLVLALSAVAGCLPARYVETGWDQWPADTLYQVSGRVMTAEYRPVERARVVVVRRKSTGAWGWAENRPQGPPANEIAKASPRDPDLLVVSEQFAAVTDRAGEYAFQFRPWGAYDVWVYFDALDQGFSPQMLKLNPLLRDAIGRGAGRSPVRVNIVLEPLQNRFTGRAFCR